MFRLRRSRWIDRTVIILAVAMTFGLVRRSSCATVAADNATDPAYMADPMGAWNGLNPTVGENPSGMDDGGFGFQPWDFRGGFHNPDRSPYGNLNHFIDGVDFSHREANNLGSPAFGLTNAGNTPADAFWGYTARATRTFEAPMTVGQTLSVDFDNPAPQPLDPFIPSGFLFRLNKGGGPITDPPRPGVVERFGIFTTSNFNQGRWYTTDSEEFADTAVAPSDTVSGATLKFTLTGSETYTAAFERLSDGFQLFSRSGTLNNAGAGPIDSIEITLFKNGSSSTGSREFFFNNLRIEDSSTPLVGDYNLNGEVDAPDYAIWRDTLDQVVPPGTGADGDKSGTIGPPDYEIWRAHFGNKLPAASSAIGSVPEPSTAYCLLSSVTFGLSLYFSRRRNGARD